MDKHEGKEGIVKCNRRDNMQRLFPKTWAPTNGMSNRRINLHWETFLFAPFLFFVSFLRCCPWLLLSVGSFLCVCDGVVWWVADFNCMAGAVRTLLSCLVCVYLDIVFGLLCRPLSSLSVLSSLSWCCVDTLDWSVSVHISVWYFMMSLSLPMGDQIKFDLIKKIMFKKTIFPCASSVNEMAFILPASIHFTQTKYYNKLKCFFTILLFYVIKYGCSLLDKVVEWSHFKFKWLSYLDELEYL